MTEPVVDHAVAAPAARLRRYVRRYIGYRYAGLRAGRHLGLPSRDVTIVLALDAPTRMAALPDPRQPPTSLAALAGGLHTRPVVIEHDGAMEGVQLALTPAGARALLGVPAGELTGAVVPLDALLGREADRLLERLHAAGGWPARFALLDDALSRRLRPDAARADPLERAWALLVGSGGAAGVGEVARAVGYSRRRLTARFAREYGLGPKEVGRVARFERSHVTLKADPGRALADVAVSCGYCDQSHMAREWNALAGCPPSQWLATEAVPFIQAEDAAGARS